MGEVSDEIELDLGLSIGRSFKKSENSKPIGNDSLFLQHPNGTKCNGFDADVMDPQTKREIHALRRQEAKRKREEKQQKRGQGRARNGEMCINGGASSVSDDEKVWLKAQDQCQAKGDDFDPEEGQCKRNKAENGGSGHLNSNIMNGGSEQQMGYGSASPYPIMQMQYPYPQIQYLPLSNGFAIPYVMPCWAPNAAAAAAGNEKQVVQPVACRSFLPFQANQNSGVNLTNGCESKQNGSGGNRRATSNGSPMCSSSVVSDNRSTSDEGGSSSDTRSHSSRSLPDQPQMNNSIADGPKSHVEHNASSNVMESTQGLVKTNHIEKAVVSNNLQSNPAPTKGEANGPNYIEKPIAASNVAQPNPTESREEGATESQPDPANNKPRSPAENPKEAKGEIGKPPRPQTQNHCSRALPQMPCVSTTGNGPNGRTITGFLYRYTKTEVSIVCVCHGNSFSPAEFVAHAGGTDVTNPLRHITVVPSALG